MLRSSLYKAYFNRSACIVDKSCDLLPPVPARHEEQQIGRFCLTRARDLHCGGFGLVAAAQSTQLSESMMIDPKITTWLQNPHEKWPVLGQAKHACMSMR